MRSARLAALIACALPFAAFAQPPKPAEDVVLYSGATIIDGTGAAPRGNQDMLVRGDRIIALVMRLTDPEIRADMSRPSLPFGDGKSGPRIAAAMIEWVAAQSDALRRTG